MTLFASATGQSPKAYDLQNLQGGQLATRLQNSASAAVRASLRTAQQDTAYQFAVHPAETAAGYTAADLSFGFLPGHAARYKVVGDGVTDDTANLQKCLNVAEQTNGPIAYIPPGFNCKTTAQLNYTGNNGIWCDVGAKISPAFVPAGANLCGLQINVPLYGRFRIHLEGGGGSLAGLVLNNPKTSHFAELIVNSFNGPGIVISHCWDCTFAHVSVESCGNANTTDFTALGVGLGVTDNYAFGMFDGGDTCNMTHILRLQVELATAKAIYVSPNSLQCLIDNVHSEQATGAAGVTTWHLGGNRCTFNTGRYNASGAPSNSSLLVDAANCVYINLFTETDTAVSVQAYSGAVNIYSCEIDGTLKMSAGQVGQINFFGGDISAVDASVDYNYVTFWNCFAGGGLAYVTDRMFSKPLKVLSANYQLALTDARFIINYNAGAGATLTIPANATTAFPIGTKFEISNTTGNGNITIACGDTLYNTAGVTGNRTLGDFGVAYVRKLTATEWLIDGSNIT